MTSLDRPDRLLTFAHIPKAAGQTLIALLRRHFGLRHVDVGQRAFKGNCARDLRFDLRVYPWARSLSGHWLKPYIDFEEFNDRFVWYTFLRDPIKRFISQYQFGVERMGFRMEFEEWVSHIQATGGPIRNVQVCHMAGTEDLEAAKQIMAEKVAFVGLVERFNASLLVWRRRMGLEAEGLSVAYAKPRNVGTGELAQRIRDNFEDYRRRILEYNALDVQLHEYAMNTLWPRQVAEYGGEEALKKDVEAEFAQPADSFGDRLRKTVGLFYRNLVYKPLMGANILLRRKELGVRHPSKL
jgi:hypothetical protein